MCLCSEIDMCRSPLSLRLSSPMLKQNRWGKKPAIFIRASLASGVAIGTFVHGLNRIPPSNSNSPLIWRPNSPASARRKICLGFGANRGRGGRSVRTRWAFSKVMDQMGEGRLMRIARFFGARNSDATWSKHIAVLLANFTILMSVTAIKARLIGHGHFLHARREPQGSLRSKTNSWRGSQYRRQESRSLPGSG